MPELTLEEETFGDKRRHFNKLVADAVASKHYELTPTSDTDSDIDNLLKIEVACKTRNVDYVIEVMKSKDMLYAATAIKKSTWLITDPQYANIINPEYLHTQLKPYMTTKAFNKLLLHIRLNLKDETRVEAFYEHFKDTDSACKWLQNCSIPFIENTIKNERLIPVWLFKRLCKKSARFLSLYAHVEPHEGDAEQASQYYTYIAFMLKSHTDDGLKMLEDQRHEKLPKLGKKKTEILMKKYRQNVLGNFDRYIGSLDLSVFIKYLQKNEIKTYLQKALKHLSKEDICKLDTWKHFLNNMPQENKFKFIKNTLIDQNEINLLLNGEQQYEVNKKIQKHQWYEFTTFEEAFSDFKNKMSQQSKPSERWGLLSTLILCAKNDIENIKLLVKYVAENHINEPFKFKKEFVNTLISNVSIHDFDVETWNYLNQLFHSLEVYVESKKRKMQLSLQAVVLYNILHNEPVPEIVEQKNTFNGFTNMHKTLNEEQKSKLFAYMLDTSWAKIKTENVVDESDFDRTLHKIENVLILLKDFNKTIADYPFLVEKIRELIKIKEEHEWTTDMSSLYEVNKSWRKYMFEESLSLSPCEETCLNALKHKPQLLTLHDKQIHTLRTNDTVSLRRVLAKLRVYWPDSLARHWTEAYMQSLNGPTGHKAVIEGLFVLMSESKIKEFSSKYVPNNFKITWGLTDHTEVNIRKNIAKYLHVARPLVPLDTVLWYAKEDYLQYTVPSLNALLSNLNEIESRKYLPLFLDAPVSLLKFGLLLVFLKFEASELINIFTNVWNSTENPSLKSVIFQHTYNKIRDEKNSSNVKELWKLLNIILNGLSFQQKISIYKKFNNIETVPICIQANMFMKCYEFFSTLPDTHNNESYFYKLFQCVPKVMESLDEDFVQEKLLSPAGTKFCTNNSVYIDSFACYVLFGDKEENQLLRFKKVLYPAMEEVFKCWKHNFYGTFYVQKQLNQLLDSLAWYFRVYFTLNKVPIPTQLFAEIETTLKQGIPVSKNYVVYTSWKLVTEYIKLLKDHRSVADAFKLTNFSISRLIQRVDYNPPYMAQDAESIWKDIHSKLAPAFGPMVVNFLKEDSERYSSTVFNLFSDAFEKMFEILGFRDNDFVLETVKYMLDDQDFIPIYLVVSKAVSKYCDKYYKEPYNKSIMAEIREKLKTHPSNIVKVHYCNDFGDGLEK